ncbi:MAG: hypothetical protein US69_C0015G0021 [candidate division TM6 bacterium GW2011_GWF2_38_10]|nr:MAG: hypothetical protein US69_C0015G0021 [candidate division TM6 bacterium GW2011_GWF2_38_10]
MRIKIKHLTQQDIGKTITIGGWIRCLIFIRIVSLSFRMQKTGNVTM